MGMVLEHELSACYAAGSLGGTLGRLNESIRRLSRAYSTGSREIREEAEVRLIEPLRLALLNQTQRLMADAWQSRTTTATRQFSHLEELLDVLKETALGRLGSRRKHPGQQTYQVLAQALANLKRLEQLRM